MAAVEEKKQRTISSRAFTRCYNRLNESILNKSPKDMIITKFDDLKKLWENLQSKHDIYLIAKHPEEDEDFVDEQEDKWLDKYEERFELVQKSKYDYLQSLDTDMEMSSKLKMKEEMSTQSKRALQTALMHRDSLHLIFKQEINNLEENMKRDTDGVLKPQVLSGMKDVKSYLDKCKDAQLSYIYHDPGTNPEEENQWIEDIQAKYETCNEKLFRYMKRVSEAETKEKRKIITKMESIKMPTFNGNIREYAKFKADFKSQVENRLESPETLTYVLRSCLKEEALYLVENIGDAAGIWQRLDDRFGKPSLLIDAIMDEIKSIGSLKEGDSKEFIKFVNIVEKGYADLLRLNLEREISNSVTVSMLEGRLPPITRREWSKEVNCANSKVDLYNKFPSFMNFLKEQRKILEYETASLRMVKEENVEKQGQVNYGVRDPLPYGSERAKVWCSIHKSGTHSIEDCWQYKNKPPQEQFETIKRLKACWSCLNIGHRLNECPDKKECGVNKCTMFHHASLHATLAVRKPYTPLVNNIYANQNTNYPNQLSASANPYAAVNSHPVAHTNTECYEIPSGKCLLPIMKIQSGNQNLSVLWDSGATISMITFKKAKELKLQGKDCRLSVTKVGGQREQIESRLYTLPLLDKNNKVVNFKVYGIETITEGTEIVDIGQVSHLFRRVIVEEVQRLQGEIEILIGFNYAKFHPRRMQTSNDLLLMENRFGKCIAGCHPKLKETQHLVVNNAQVYAFKAESFLELEEMGIQCFPRCGNCHCKKCALGSKGLSIKEEKEQNLINNGLIYIEEEHRFISTYPWTKDPEELPDNYNVAKAIMENTERRLRKDPSHAKLYDDQFKDLLERGAARILRKEEMENYDGPVYYLDHHEVLKEGSTTTCRLVFNSSRKFQGECINDYWGKGANQVNNLMGVLIRFRELKVVIVGDIKKMYHVISISLLDQHTHRFLWRNLETHRNPDVYIMQVVSFGDKPAGNIAIAALNKTAEMGRESFPKAAEIITANAYVDDIIDSLEDEATAKKVTEEIDEVLELGGFKIKEWAISSADGPDANNATKTFTENKQTVLGMHWDRSSDSIQFSAKLEFSKGKKQGGKSGSKLSKEDIPDMVPLKLTKRMVIAVINSIFDPLGLIAPFTVKAKFLMRNLWLIKLDWDDVVTATHKENILQFFKELFDVELISFKRCLKPDRAIEDPVLVTFSDASSDAFGACTYLRWKVDDNSYKSVLVASKNRVSPLKTQSIVRLELCAAVVAKRLAQFVEEETRFNIKERYFFIDSQIVKSMICKESHAFQTFVAVRLGEIHYSTKPSEWFWIDGQHNIADWITRGKSPMELNATSVWQCGPDFLSKPEAEWPINSNVIDNKLPEENEVVVVSNIETVTSIENVIDINRYSSYMKLIHVTARVLSAFKHNPKPSFRNSKTCTAELVNAAEMKWVKEAQKLLQTNLNKGKYQRLCPKVSKEEGVIIVEGRVEALFSDSYASTGLILLPHNHRFSRLYAEYIHCISHLGSAATMCKIRDRFWITKLATMVNNIRNKCVTCKKLNASLQQQIMAPIPLHRLKPAPAFSNTYVDFFGPFKVRGVVNKRSCGKAFGVIFTCGNSRAVHCDLAQNYSMDGFLQTFRRFTSIRGFPANMWSDCGTQLVATDKELREMIKGFDEEELIKFGADKGLEWHFSPPGAPWHNGCVESLVKSVKKAIKVAIGDQVLSFPELQCVLFEVSNIVNERPIGVFNRNIEDGKYLCPNNLLLGRASSRVPSGPFGQDCSPRRRFLFVQRLNDSFWKIWIRDYFPCLVIRQKWHVEKRNLKVGDVVLMRDLNAIRGYWQLGQVTRVYPSDAQIVRQVDIRYKIPTNKKCSVVKRAVQSLVVLLPIEEDVATI